jgi:hypothetical protein
MREIRPLVLLAVLLLLASCAKPPQAEIDAAKAAMDTTAKSADVVTYAPDELRLAQEKIAALDAEVAAQARRSPLSRNYDATRALAHDATGAATQALMAAAATKQQVAQEAAALAEEITSSIPQFESKVWAARRVPRIKLDLIMPLGLLPEQAREVVQDARQDISAGAFATAKAKLQAIKDQLATCEETIAEQTRIARSR